MTGILTKSLADIQKKLKAPKGQFNKFANFNYRSCEDILEAVKPLLGDLVLLIGDEVVQLGDRYYVKATVILSDGENEIKSCAYARESETKTGMDASQITGASSSYARKYALNGMFAIDDTADADTKDNKPSPSPEPNKVKEPDLDDLKPEDFVSPTKPNKEPLRDTKGHTYCSTCGKVINPAEEKFSMSKYGKTLCFNCQKKEVI